MIILASIILAIPLVVWLDRVIPDIDAEKLRNKLMERAGRRNHG